MTAAAGNGVDLSRGDVLVTASHLHTAPRMGGEGFCEPAAQRFFRRYGLDWERFVREGIPARELIATGNGLALRVVAHAQAEAAGG